MAFKYASPETIEEASQLLHEYGAEAALLAGGTDLVADIRSRQKSPRVVIALRRLREFRAAITLTSTGINIGAMATLTEIAEHPVIVSQFPAVAEAAGKIGSRQIRNWATMVGNLCNASPAADTIPALLIYEAVINTTDFQGRRLPVARFVEGPRKTALLPGEIVSSIFLPNPPANSSSCYVRFARREGPDLATVGVATMALANGESRIALGAVAPMPFRAVEAEEMLRCGWQDPTVLQAAVRMAAQSANPISDLRASREYRLHLIQVLTAEALRLAHARVAGGGMPC